jgi:hypothetical protein
MALQDAVFVLGAGASRPFNFPVESELRELVITQDHPAVSEKFPAAEIKKFKDEFRSSMALSTHSFLQRCDMTGRSVAVEIGMASIAAALLPREQLSLDSQPDWYAQLFADLLHERSIADDRRLQVITFNYDRSLEYFFLRGFMAADRLFVAEAAEKFRKRIDLLHVYGQLGHLPEFLTDPSQIGVPYGSVEDIFRAVFSMKIVGRPNDAGIEQRLLKGDFIVFIGFGFQDENLTLLRLDQLPAKTIISTGLGISDGMRHSLQQRFPQHEWFFGDEQQDARMFLRNIDLFRQLKTPEALREYARARRS